VGGWKGAAGLSIWLPRDDNEAMGPTQEAVENHHDPPAERPRLRRGRHPVRPPWKRPGPGV